MPEDEKRAGGSGVEFEQAEKEWRQQAGPARERPGPFQTVSGKEVKDLYTLRDTAGLDYLRDLGFPGAYPFTRGVRANMYRGRLWTMRQFSGFGDAADSNRRYRYLLEQGQTGLSVAFDMPTIMGYDSEQIGRAHV